MSFHASQGRYLRVADRTWVMQQQGGQVQVTEQPMQQTIILPPQY